MRRIFFLFFFFIPFLNLAQSQPAKILLQRMLTACDALKSAKFILYSTERMESDKFAESKMLVKIQTKPVKIYLYTLSPHPGAEGLWLSGQKDQRALINPNGF